MILDDTLVFSDAQAITATAASTNVIDIGAAGTPYGAGTAVRRDIGVATNIPITVTVTETFATLTSLTISLQVDSTAAFSSPATVATGPTVAAAALLAGTQLSFPAEIPEGVNEQYVRLLYTVAGSDATAGKITAAIVAGRQTN